jgi:hypothetical protein
VSTVLSTPSLLPLQSVCTKHENTWGGRGEGKGIYLKQGDIVVLDKIKAKILETEQYERSEKNVFLKELKNVKIFPTKPCFSRG